MPFHIRDPETDTLVRELARRQGCGLTEAVKSAVAEKLDRAAPALPMLDAIAEIQREIAFWPKTGLKADKAFFDDLSGDGD
jgi:antitoxin VapB